MELAFSKVYGFWYTHGMRLEAEHGPDTFKYELVQKMGALHANIAAVIDKPIIREQYNSVSAGQFRRKIQDIVSLQNRHIMQFECCLDEFNRYMNSLRVLDLLHVV